MDLFIRVMGFKSRNLSCNKFSESKKSKHPNDHQNQSAIDTSAGYLKQVMKFKY